MTNRIKQQESAIEMLRMLVSSKRASPAKLEAAINELNRLKAELVSSNEVSKDPVKKTSSAPRKSKMVSDIMKDVTGDIFALKQSGLSHEISRLRRDQADLSNMLHKIDRDQECPELTEKILDIHNKIEELWTQKKFLERNKSDGPNNPVHDQQIIDRSIDAVQTKSDLSVKLQQFREKRSKLRDKLKNPKATADSISKWQIELEKIQIAINEATTKRALI